MKLEKSQWILLVLTVLFITFTLAYFIGRNSVKAVITTQNAAQPAPAQSTSGQEAAQAQNAQIMEQPRVNLNTATAEDLEELPGIGPKLAERILVWREENGGFLSVEQLMDINGIAEGKFEEIKDFVFVEETQ